MTTKLQTDQRPKGDELLATNKHMESAACRSSNLQLSLWDQICNRIVHPTVQLIKLKFINKHQNDDIKIFVLLNNDISRFILPLQSEDQVKLEKLNSDFSNLIFVS